MWWDTLSCGWGYCQLFFPQNYDFYLTYKKKLQKNSAILTDSRVIWKNHHCGNASCEAEHQRITLRFYKRKKSVASLLMLRSLFLLFSIFVAPHHALDSYLPRLVRAGLRVAICDALEAAAPAKRGRKPKAAKAQPTNEELFTNAWTLLFSTELLLCFIISPYLCDRKAQRRGRFLSSIWI